MKNFRAGSGCRDLCNIEQGVFLIYFCLKGESLSSDNVKLDSASGRQRNIGLEPGLEATAEKL